MQVVRDGLALVAPWTAATLVPAGTKDGCLRARPGKSRCVEHLKEERHGHDGVGGGRSVIA